MVRCGRPSLLRLLAVGRLPAIAALLLLSRLEAASAAPEAEPVRRGRMPIRSMLEIRQEGVVKQGWDLSCGAAALSTVLTFTYGDPVSELDIIRAMLRQTTPERIRSRHGFSLLDLKRFALARGYAADGYGRLDLAGLARLAPAIVPISIGDLNHFVVVRGIAQDRVMLADPGFGNRTMTLERFEGLWPSRIAFVVRRRSQGGAASHPGAGPERAALVPLRVVRNEIGAHP